MPAAAFPSTQSILQVLTKERLLELGRIYNLSISPNATKDKQILELIGSGFLPFRYFLRYMSRDELKAACRLHEMDDSGGARLDLAQRLLEAHGDQELGVVIDSPDLGSRVEAQWRGLVQSKIVTLYDESREGDL